MTGHSMPRSAAKAVVLLAAALFAGAAGGCFRAQARTVPEMPALDAPSPPPRVVDVVDVLEASPIESPARLEPPDQPTPRVEAARPEVPPRPQPAPEAQAVPEEGPPAPSATLQTMPPGGQAELEKAIRALLTRAAANLSNIDYGRLHPDTQAQYDQAKRFISQAEAAVASKNLPFAHNLADKAATLASQLAGR